MIMVSSGRAEEKKEVVAKPSVSNNDWSMPPSPV